MAKFLAVVIAISVSLAGLSLSQDASPIPKTAAEVEARAQALAVRTDINQAERDRLAGIYRQGLDAWKRAEALAGNAQRFRQELKDAPARRDKAKAELDKPLAAPEIKQPDQLSQAQLEAAFARAQADSAAAKVKVEDWEKALNQRKDRLAKIPAETTKARADLADVEKKLAEAKPGDEAASANAGVLIARKAELEHTAAALNDELNLVGANPELLSLERDLAVRESGRLGKLTDLWREQVEKRRNEQLRKAAQQAEDEAKNSDVAAVRALADGNQALVKERKRLADPSRRSAESEETRKRLAEQFRSTSERVAVVERMGAHIGDDVGRLLQRQRVEIPGAEGLQEEIQKSVQEAANLELNTMSWREERQSLSGDLDALTAKFLSDHGLTGEGEARHKVAVRQLLESKRLLLDQLLADSAAYQTALARENQALQESLRVALEFRRFIDERVLWIRSDPPLRLDRVGDAASEVGRLASANGWRQGLRSLADDAGRWPLIWLLAAAVAAFLFYKRREYSKRLASAGQAAAKSVCTNFVVTLKALAYSVLLALPLPLTLFFVSARCQVVEAPAGLGEGFWAAGMGLLTLGFSRQLFHSLGLVPKHFDVPESLSALVHRHLRWLNWGLAPLNFGYASSLFNGHSAVARWFFLGVMFFLAVFALLVFRPARRLLTLGGKSAALQPFVTPIYLAAIAVPVLSIVAAILGYFYSVTELFWRMQATFRVVVGVLLATFLILRWLLLARRKLAFEQARKRRRAAAEAAGKGDDAGPTQAEVEAELVDISRVKQQSDRLVKSAAWLAVFLGVWGVWRDVVPALTILDKVRLWGGPPSAEVAGAALSPGEAKEGAQAAKAPVSGVGGAVTLKDFALCVFTLFLTWIAAHNIPGLLECSILRRLDLKAGGSYAITTTARYVLVLVGVILAFGFIQVSWSKVQWLAAAITVGIGFGLQEIFANFVAGLILLFERPIRVGDWVTVGETSGRVTQIRMRATTILDPRHTELIVPNKEFITGKLINWTLSDPIVRADVRVGVASGSDTKLTQDLLLKAAKENPLVLRNPPPNAVFLGIGASSLDFELRVFVKDIDDQGRVRSELHFAVDRYFREANIEIAFPQTDVHIKSLPPKATVP